MIAELEIAKVVLEGWEVVAHVADPTDSLERILKLVRKMVPIESIVLRSLNYETKSVESIAVAGGFSLNATSLAPMVCTEAKWTGLDAWTRTGATLRQLSPKRSGKLSTLTPIAIRNEVVGIPLRPSLPLHKSLVTLGAVIFEIESNRSFVEDHVLFLERWCSPLWLLLELFRLPKVVNPSVNRDGADKVESEFGKADDAREAIVGSETGLRSVMERVHIVAPSDMPVLILGETGTGKEVAARAIHHRSPRAAKPFIRVNCGAIPSELIDSQLFGHERGSFTGASDRRKGWFERADGGTLFLDEIGELPLAAQVRLLRVLQDHQIERVGGQESMIVDVRIVAATHRDLSAMVHQKTFREDLWYRINMFPILLPRLCERTNDIPALARHFARKAAHRFGLTYVEPGPLELKQLVDYRWPGNIRELQAVIDRAVILGGGTSLEVNKSLGNSFMHPMLSQQQIDEPTFYEVIPESFTAITNIQTSQQSVDDGPIDSLDIAITRHIERALLSSNGQIEGNGGAAKLLGINPHTLRARMRKLEIDWDRFRR